MMSTRRLPLTVHAAILDRIQARIDRESRSVVAKVAALLERSGVGFEIWIARHSRGDPAALRAIARGMRRAGIGAVMLPDTFRAACQNERRGMFPSRNRPLELHWSQVWQHPEPSPATVRPARTGPGGRS